MLVLTQDAFINIIYCYIYILYIFVSFLLTQALPLPLAPFYFYFYHTCDLFSSFGSHNTVSTDITPHRLLSLTLNRDFFLLQSDNIDCLCYLDPSVLGFFIDLPRLFSFSPVNYQYINIPLTLSCALY